MIQWDFLIHGEEKTPPTHTHTDQNLDPPFKLQGYTLQEKNICEIYFALHHGSL